MNAEQHPVSTFDLGPRRAWAWLTVGVTFVGVAEVIGMAAILHAVLPLPVALLIDVLVAVPTFGLLVTIASALRGRITVDPEFLRLEFGLLGGAEVPRSQIHHAETYVPPAISPVGLGIDVPVGSLKATASRGGHPRFVRVHLDRPIEVRTALWRRARASELVMGTGEPDQLIAALT